MPAHDPLKPASDKPLAWRLAALAVALCTYLLGRDVITPWVAGQLAGWLPHAEGPRLFMQHLVTFSLPTASLCLVAWVGLARAGLLPSPRPWLGLGPQWRKSVRWGVWAGVGVSAVVVVIAVVAGEQLRLHPDGWKIAGNCFSNYYEELEYRGLLTMAGAVAFRNRWAGVVLSSAVFGWSHGSKGPGFMILAGVVGLIFGWIWIRTRSLVAPWLAHQVSDAILDSL